MDNTVARISGGEFDQINRELFCCSSAQPTRVR